ncbi:DUF4267 domain-containing protein [Actinosynnema sp. NPDC023658]|uniref:DUF4267 domain-containing protein n=1 Tax=Actinosynnema sp. NPDC023658 TaxID=3155465 RepID=UPI003404A0CA
MLTTVATVLAGLIGLAIVVVGLRLIRVPQSAAGFGITGTPTEDRAVQSWLAVVAGRDIAFGLFTLVLVIAGSPHLLGWFMLVTACVPAWDAVVVLRGNGPRSAVYGIHGGTAAVMLVIGVLLLVG